MIVNKYKVALIAFCCSLPLLMAPTGGFPSRPNFQHVTVKGASSQVEIVGTSASASNTAFLEFKNSAATRVGYVGDSSTSNNNVSVVASMAGADVVLQPGTGGEVLAAGSPVCLQSGVGCSVVRSSGSFTATFTGFSPTGLTSTGTYEIVGNIACVNIPNVSGPSNSTTFTITGLPSAISTAVSTPAGFIVGADNGIVGIKTWAMAPGTTVISLIDGLSSSEASTWSSIGSKSILRPFNACWSLN